MQQPQPSWPDEQLRPTSPRFRRSAKRCSRSNGWRR